jgi:hypothetical protein
MWPAVISSVIAFPALGALFGIECYPHAEFPSREVCGIRRFNLSAASTAPLVGVAAALAWQLYEEEDGKMMVVWGAALLGVVAFLAALLSLV